MQNACCTSNREKFPHDGQSLYRCLVTVIDEPWCNVSSFMVLGRCAVGPKFSGGSPRRTQHRGGGTRIPLVETAVPPSQEHARAINRRFRRFGKGGEEEQIGGWKQLFPERKRLLLSRGQNGYRVSRWERILRIPCGVIDASFAAPGMFPPVRLKRS